jgi:tripartite-type tricarboxylate transporter receptor subunit TctC
MIRIVVLFILLLAAPPLVLSQQTWPTRPIRILNPAPAGGGSEILSRRLASKLEPALGQSVIVESRPGASGTICTAAAAQSPADGYTLLFGHLGTFAMAPHLMKGVGYDAIRDFKPVSTLTVSPMLLLVNASFPVRSVRELVDLAKQRPSSISSSSTGLGTPSHIALEFFQQLAGIRLVHVPYKGSAPALVDLAGGQVQMGFDYNVVAAPHIKSGKLRALAVTSRKRIPSMPDVPTAREAGYPQLEIDTWTGILVPAGTPQSIIDRLNREIVRAMHSDDVRLRVEEAGSQVHTSTPTEFADLIKHEYSRWGEVISSAGIRIEE